MNLPDKSRRAFVRNTIMGSTALLSYPWLEALANEPTVSMSAADKVRIGIIGVGSRGQGLLYNLLAMEVTHNIEITAICDNYEPNYQKAVEITHGKAQAFYDYRKLLEIKDIDAIVIATPLHQHAHIAIDAMKANKQVFCEKAMARTLEDTKRMADTHYETGKILQIGHQRLFDKKYLDAIDYVRSGKIGDVTQIRAYWHRNNDWRRPVPEGKPELDRKINWRLYKEYSCGLMTELASHQIQVANWVKDAQPVSVIGVGGINYWKEDREVYDNVALIYSYADGTQFIYDSMVSNRFYGLEEQILGDKGTLELEQNKMYSENPPQPAGILQLVNNIENGIFEKIPIGGATWIPETALKYKGEYITEDFDVNETRTQLEAFVDSVRRGKPTHGLFEQGYKASVWTLLGQQAMETQQKVFLPEELKT
ncbi:MAG: Gfo/Idh/MocA family oxidoreductase [Bacteroidota bacterium]|nr:Gfo/Idh/MocA family oxidoreductase [Bacteroidota bacterium]